MCCRRRSMDDMERAPVLALAPVLPLAPDFAASSDSMSCDASGVADVSMSNSEDDLRGFSSGSDAASGCASAGDVEVVLASASDVGFGGGGVEDEGGVARKRTETGEPMLLGKAVCGVGVAEVRATAWSVCLAATWKTMTVDRALSESFRACV